MKYLIDTEKIISEGSGITNYHNWDLIVTSYTWQEIQNKNLKVDSTNISIIKSPSFRDFKNVDGPLFTWTDGTAILQIVQYQQKLFVPAICEKHYTIAQLSLVESNISANICGELLYDDVDFSQITALVLKNQIKPAGTGDKCLNITLNQILELKNNSTFGIGGSEIDLF